MLRDMGPVTRDNEASEEMVALTKITLRCDRVNPTACICVPPPNPPKRFLKRGNTHTLFQLVFREKLLSIGVDALLVDELVTVATRVNYGNKYQY